MSEIIRRAGMKRGTPKKVAVYLLAFLISLFFLAPFYWLIISSVSPLYELTTRPPHWFPEDLDFSRILMFLDLLPFGAGITSGQYQETAFKVLSGMRNSLIISSSVTAITLVLASMAAYSISRLSFRHRNKLFLMLLSVMIIPPVVLVFPLFITFKIMGLLDSYLALILTYNIFTMPFAVWILKQYFDTIPRELEEAAYVDGCSKLGVVFRIFIPVAAPGVIAAGIFTFMLCWSEFLFAIVFTKSIEVMPLTVIVGGLGERVYSELSAAGIYTALPPIVIILVFQRFLVRGLTAGSVKG